MAAACHDFALSVYALPKTGSTFMSAFLKQLATSAQLCRVHEMRYRCSATITVSCPPLWGGKQKCQRKRRGPKGAGLKRCTWQSQASQIFRLPPACCDSLDPAEGSELLDEPPSTLGLATAAAERFSAPEGATCAHRRAEADEWFARRPRHWMRQGTTLRRLQRADLAMRATSGTVQPALRSAGFVHGPQRQLPTASGATAALSLRVAFSAHVTSTVVLLHTRHPIEAMVSHYFCVSNQTVCPRRHALLESANRSTTVASRSGSSLGRGLDFFLLKELSGDESTSLNQMLQRMERLAAFHAEAQRSNFTSGGSSTQERGTTNVHAAARAGGVRDVASDSKGQAPFGCNARRTGLQPWLTVVHSRYEHMVSDFGAWLHELLATLPPLSVSKQALHDGLLARFGADFVPDGKHKHALRPGSNLRRLQPETIKQLRGMPRIDSIVRQLGYGW